MRERHRVYAQTAALYRGAVERDQYGVLRVVAAAADRDGIWPILTFEQVALRAYRDGGATDTVRTSVNALRAAGLLDVEAVVGGGHRYRITGVSL